MAASVLNISDCMPWCVHIECGLSTTVSIAAKYYDSARVENYAVKSVGYLLASSNCFKLFLNRLMGSNGNKFIEIQFHNKRLYFNEFV